LPEIARIRLERCPVAPLPLFVVRDRLPRTRLQDCDVLAVTVGLVVLVILLGSLSMRIVR
jgi:hypothetical protein